MHKEDTKQAQIKEQRVTDLKEKKRESETEEK